MWNIGRVIYLYKLERAGKVYFFEPYSIPQIFKKKITKLHRTLCKVTADAYLGLYQKSTMELLRENN